MLRETVYELHHAFNGQPESLLQLSLGHSTLQVSKRIVKAAKMQDKYGRPAADPAEAAGYLKRML
jgi:hypothetical protein